MDDTVQRTLLPPEQLTLAVDELLCFFELPGYVIGKQTLDVRMMTSKKTGKLIPIQYKPTETREYERSIGWAAKSAMTGRAPFEGTVAVDLIVYMVPPRSWSQKKRAQALAGLIRPNVKPDWDNIGKTLDGAKGVVWLDDKQICDGRVRKFYARSPGLSVTVRRCE